jgi:hypothetical protein
MQETTKAIEEASEVIGQASETVEQASQSIEQMTESFGEIEQYVEQFTGAMQQGVDSTNSVMQWYTNYAIPENPWINPPITEEEVENAIRICQNEALAYIERSVDKNSTYDLISEEDAGFFAEYFEDKDAKALLLSTYEKPEDRDTGVDGEDYEGKLVCNGGFFYNNLYVIMMKPEEADVPFALTVLSKEDDGSVNIHANYWSENLENIDWSGSVIYELYDEMLDSDLKAVLNIPGLGGDITLGSAIDAVGGLKGKDIDDALELVSDKKDKVKTYIQEFDGYDVYYSNLDPSAAGEFIVSQIDVKAGDFMTAEGVGIGTGISKTKKIYGEGLEAMMDDGRKQLMYEMGKYNMLFTFDKAGKVEEMTMFLAAGLAEQ